MPGWWDNVVSAFSGIAGGAGALGTGMAAGYANAAWLYSRAPDDISAGFEAAGGISADGLARARELLLHRWTNPGTNPFGYGRWDIPRIGFAAGGAFGMASPLLAGAAVFSGLSNLRRGRYLRSGLQLALGAALYGGLFYAASRMNPSLGAVRVGLGGR